MRSTSYFPSLSTRPTLLVCPVRILNLVLLCQTHSTCTYFLRPVIRHTALPSPLSSDPSPDLAGPVGCNLLHHSISHVPTIKPQLRSCPGLTWGLTRPFSLFLFSPSRPGRGFSEPPFSVMLYPPAVSAQHKSQILWPYWSQ